jgi:nucleotide-binding universal stress UspA family protein
MQGAGGKAEVTMKVLVPLDGSQLSEKALVPALELLKSGDQLFLIHAFPHHDHALIDGGAAYLEGVRKRVLREGLEVRWFLEQGEPAERIVALARETDPTLILMSSHGKTGDASIPRGSVAEQVMRTAVHPLLLFNPRAEWTPFKRILLAHDGSSFSDVVIEPALALARSFESSITLLKVYEQPHQDEALSELDPLVERLRQSGLPVELRGTVGSTTTEVAREAEEYDLVCVATHGRSGISRWWFGSVAEGLLRSCGCPLLVVRHADVSAVAS